MGILPMEDHGLEARPEGAGEGSAAFLRPVRAADPPIRMAGLRYIRLIPQARDWAGRAPPLQHMFARGAAALCALREFLVFRARFLPTPSLPVLEKWAKAMDVELHQHFVVGHGQPEAPALPQRNPVGTEERTLLRLFGQMGMKDRSPLMSLAHEMTRQEHRAIQAQGTERCWIHSC
jgi:hypothetical protein